jgi:hypothetical protein
MVCVISINMARVLGVSGSFNVADLGMRLLILFLRQQVRRVVRVIQCGINLVSSLVLVDKDE